MQGLGAILALRVNRRFDVKMAAIGFNFRRILKWLEALVLWLIVWMWANTTGVRKMAVCCVFRGDPATHTDLIWPGIPGHPATPL
jgi:hypothetical protein